jgi:signal peptidase I
MTKKRASRAQTRTKSREPRGPRVLLRARAIILGYLPVIVIFLGTRALLAEAYRIPSGSMEPTLQVGDWLFVNKLRLGPHIPFSKASLPGYAHPERNDVVVFVSPPQDAAIRISPREITPTLVKRIIGMPGDTVLMRHGELFVNGTVVVRRNTESVVPDSLTDQRHALFAWQHSIEVQGSRFGSPTAAPSLHDWGPLLVPPAMFFMIGDNRDNSVDGRYYGPVPRANLRGTPMFVYYSYDPEEGLDYFRAITEIRWHRLGTWIR